MHSLIVKVFIEKNLDSVARLCALFALVHSQRSGGRKTRVKYKERYESPDKYFINILLNSF